MRITKSTRLGFLQQMILCARKCIEILNNLFHSHFAPFEFWWIEFRKECLFVMNRRKKNWNCCNWNWNLKIEFWWKLKMWMKGATTGSSTTRSRRCFVFSFFFFLCFCFFKSFVFVLVSLSFQIKVSQINNCLLISAFYIQFFFNHIFFWLKKKCWSW